MRYFVTVVMLIILVITMLISAASDRPDHAAILFAFLALIASVLFDIRGELRAANELHTDRQLWALQSEVEAARRANKKPSRWFR